MLLKHLLGGLEVCSVVHKFGLAKPVLNMTAPHTYSKGELSPSLLHQF